VFNLTGLIYAPYSNITLSGNIGHQTGGLSCKDRTVSGGWHAETSCPEQGGSIPLSAGVIAGSLPPKEA